MPLCFGQLLERIGTIGGFSLFRHFPSGVCFHFNGVGFRLNGVFTANFAVEELFDCCFVKRCIGIGSFEIRIDVKGLGLFELDNLGLDFVFNHFHGIKVDRFRFLDFSRCCGEHVINGCSVHWHVATCHDGINIRFACLGVDRSLDCGVRAGFFNGSVENIVAGGHEFVDRVLANAAAFNLWSVEEMSVRAFVGRSRGCIRVHVLDAPDVDHQVDPAFQVSQDLDNLVGALAGQILEGAGHEDFGRLGVDIVTGRIVRAVFAQDPGLFLNLFGCFQNGLGCPLCLRDNRVELVRGIDEAVAVIAFVSLDVGDLGLRPLDCLVHVSDVEANLVKIGHLALPRDYLFESLDRPKNFRRFGSLVAIQKLLQKPTPAVGFHQGLFEGLVLGIADQPRVFLFCFRFHIAANLNLPKDRLLPYDRQLLLQGKAKNVNISLGHSLARIFMTDSPPNISARVAALFACHFFGFGLFLPFFPVVLEFRGLTAEEIGFILGAGTIARIAASPILSNLADRRGNRRLSILVYSLIGAAFIALFAAPGGLFVIGVSVIGYMVIKAPVLPLSDAYALDAARNTGADYARMRLWGSAGFVAATLIGGAVATEQQSWILLVLIALAAVATGGVVMMLPRQQRESKTDTVPEDGSDTPFRALWFWPVLTLLGLFQASHAAFYGFGTLYWQANDVADFTIGVLWAIGVIAEIALFIVAGKLALRFDPPVFLLVAGVAAIVRWSLFPFADSFVSMALLQTLHGLTFGASHLGAVAILAKVVPSRWSGTGQGLLATSIGIQMALGLSVSGTLYAMDPDMPFYLMAAISAVGVVIMIALTPMVRKHMAESQAD